MNSNVLRIKHTRHVAVLEVEKVVPLEPCPFSPLPRLLYPPSCSLLFAPFLSLPSLCVVFPVPGGPYTSDPYRETGERSGPGNKRFLMCSELKIILHVIAHLRALWSVLALRHEPVYLYVVSQKASGGLVSSRPRMYRYGIPTFSLQMCTRKQQTTSLAIAKRPCDCCIILKSGSYTKAI